MNDASNNSLVACVGDRVAESCRQAMGILNSGPRKRCHFTMSEWLDRDQFNRVLLLWVVDDSSPWDTVHRALTNYIPLLVPQDNLAMKQLCTRAGCGLTYRDGPDAAEMLAFFLSNEGNRKRMAANGYAYVNGRTDKNGGLSGESGAR